VPAHHSGQAEVGPAVSGSEVAEIDVAGPGRRPFGEAPLPAATDAAPGSPSQPEYRNQASTTMQAMTSTTLAASSTRTPAAAHGQAAAALRLGSVTETVTRRQPQTRAGQVVRADRTAPYALPPRQLTRPARRDLRPFPRGRGIRNPVRSGPPGHRVLCLTPLRNSASTSARRYRGLPASLRTSGSRPRRAHFATAAEVTRNKDATCLRVIRSSPMRLPVIAAAAILRAAGRDPSAARPDRCRRHHVHRVP
jgi:hypothetical protein